MPPGDASDAVRRAAGFLTVGGVAALAPDVSVLAPGSTLIGVDVTIGSGTVLYPGVVLEARDGGRITVGSGVRFGPGAVAVLAVGSEVTIGDAAELGPGSVTVTSAVGAPVRIGAAPRLRGSAVVEGPASLGRCFPGLGECRGLRRGTGRRRGPHRAGPRPPGRCRQGRRTRPWRAAGGR